MSLPAGFTPNPDTDLVIERELPVATEAVWAAWTEPDKLKQWFTPRPWTTQECTIDLRPGGEFTTVMKGPEGESSGGTGCYLEILPNERLVWTGALGPGFRPQAAPEEAFLFTAIIAMEPSATGTKYTVIAMHQTPEGAAKHDEMGFHAGWGAAIDQLVEAFGEG